MYTILENCPLFKGLKNSEIEALLSKLHFQVKKFNADSLIVSGGEKVERLYILLKGSVKGEMVDFSGKTIKIEDIEPPRPLAIAFLFGKDNTYPVNIISNVHSELLILSKASVLQLLQSNEVVLRNYLNAISNRSQFLSQKIKFLSFQTIKGKIGNYLLQLTGGEEASLTLPISQNEMAELFGVTRPSVGRGMRELHQEGIIHASGKQIQILDVNKLKGYLK